MGRLKWAAIWITLLSILLKLIGFLRESALAWKFGASDITNGFFLAFTFVTLTVTMVANGFNTVFLPEYLKRRREKEGREQEAEKDASGILTYSLLFFTIASLALTFLAPYFVPIVYPGVEGIEKTTTIEITQVFFLFMSFVALSNMLESYLQSLRIFVPTQIAKISGTLFSALFIFWFGDIWGIASVAYGFVFGTLIGAGIQLFYLYRGGFHFKPTLNMDFDFLKMFLWMLLPALLHASVGHLNFFVDKAFATGIDGPAVTYLNNASLLTSIPSTIFSTTLVAIIFTLLSEQSNDLPKFRSTLFSGYQLGVMLLLPIAVGLFMIGEPAIAFVYERGQFIPEDTAAVYVALKYYVPTVLLQGLLFISMRAMYARSRGAQILKVSVTTILLNVLLNYLLIGPLGYAGLALSTSLVSLYFFTTLTIVLYKEHGLEELKKIATIFVRALPPVLLMGVAIWLLRSFTPVSELYSLWDVIISGLTGVVTYAAAVYLFYRSAFDNLMYVLKNKSTGGEEN